MNYKIKTAILVFIDILALIIIIGMFILGVNLFKNRWHRINFIVDDIKVIENDEGSQYRYKIEVSGNAKTWFYDFNEYEFDLIDGASGEAHPNNVVTDGVIVANHKGDTFNFSFETDSVQDIQSYVFKAENIYIDGSEKKGTDIRLFMAEYQEKNKLT